MALLRKKPRKTKDTSYIYGISETKHRRFRKEYHIKKTNTTKGLKTMSLSYEEIKVLFSEKMDRYEKERKKIHKQRRDQMFGGKELRQIANGVAEEAAQSTERQVEEPDYRYEYYALLKRFEDLFKKNKELEQKIKKLGSGKKGMTIDSCLDFVSYVQDSVKGKRTLDKK